MSSTGPVTGTNFLLNEGLSGRSLMRTSAEGPSVDHSKLDIALLLGFQFLIWETESVRRYCANLCDRPSDGL